MLMKKLIYENPLAREQDINNFILEGSASMTFENGKMKLSSVLDPSLGQAANYVFWCPETFPKNIEITWEFTPLNDIGLCMMFFAAKGRLGEDLFDNNLKPRNGLYGSYHSGDIDAYHISYCRRSFPEERAFRTCNLRKSFGGNLVMMAGDPIPSVADSTPPYYMSIRKFGNRIELYINDLLILRYDDPETALGDGKIGFRQMSPMVAEYANLKVYELE